MTVRRSGPDLTTPAAASSTPSRVTPRPSSGRVSARVLIVSALGVLAIYSAGFLRTRAAAERLTQASGRRHQVDMADVQQVLDVARFTNAPTAPAANGPSSGSAPPTTPATATVSGGTSNPIPHVEQANTADRTLAMAADRTSASAAAPVPVTATAAEHAPAAAAAAVPVSEAPPPAIAVAGESAPPTTPTAIAVDAKPSTQVPEPPKYHDGTFVGWGYCRHGQIQSTIVIEHGRIVSAEITQCGTRYSCDWIEKLPPQVVSRQSAEVDFVSGASESADAFYYSIEDALKKAK